MARWFGINRGDLGLHIKLALAGSVSVFVCIAILSSILVYHQSSVLIGEIERTSLQLQQDMVGRGALLAKSVGTSIETAIAGYDFAFITETVKSLQRNNNNLLYAFLTNGAGIIIVHTDPHRESGQAPPLSPGGEPRYIQREDGSEVVEITQVLIVGGRQWGRLVMGFDVMPIRREAAAAVMRGKRVLAQGTTLALLITTLVALLGLAASVLVSRRLLRPVVQLAEDAAGIAEGDLSQEISAVNSSDEIGVLARQFETMRRSIQSYIEELVVAKHTAEASTLKEQQLRAELEKHSRLLEEKVKERTSDLVSINQRLTEYDQLKSEFISNVSHELRTPLAAIFAAAKIIHRYTGENTKANDKFSVVIMEETERLTRLINDLLDLSKIEEGKSRWNVVALDNPCDLIQQVVTTFRPLYAEDGIGLRLHCGSDLPVVNIDKDRLVQVLTNLCSNARKFTPRGGRVLVSATRGSLDNRPALKISVRDNGCGIPPTELKTIFERFRRASNVGRPSGTGLGLAICREVVEGHHGTIHAEEAKPQGTLMVVLLPIATDSALTPPPPQLP